MSLEEKLWRVWQLAILAILGVAGTFVLQGWINNPLTFDQVTGVLILMFAVLHTEYIARVIREVKEGKQQGAKPIQ